MRRALPCLVSALVLVACGGKDRTDGDAAGDDGDGPGPPIDSRPPDDSGQVVPGSLRFFGTGSGDIDRVEIAIDPQVPADVGAGSFTIDFWLRIPPGSVNALPATCAPGKDNWRSGAIVIDRDDSALSADHGDFGVGVFRSGVAWGVSQGTGGTGLCGVIPVTTAGWHHIGVTRDGSSGVIGLFIDGMPDGSNSGPSGDISYHDGTTGAPKDPFLVIGAEKHDTAGSHSIDGFVDELRISTVVRYTAMFTPELAPYALDADTAALYHFDEGDGDILHDAKDQSPGAIKVGDTPTGTVPVWSMAEPFVR